MPDPAVSRAGLRVVLCDDAVAYPMMVEAWFADLPSLDLVAVLGSRGELVERIGALQADVLLLDVVLPDGDVDAAYIARLRAAAGGPLRVVLVSNFLPDELETIAERAGADAWCTKLGHLDALLEALQSA